MPKIEKILVTGGAGFIGSHTVDKAIEKDYDVVVVDDLSNGKEKNINPSATFYKVDITNKEKLSEVFEKEKPDFVIHLAAHINLRYSIDNPSHDAQQNIIGSINVLECCQKYNVKKIIYSSSAAIYGFPNYLPIDEEHPVSHFSPYGISKHVVEHYLHYYHEKTNLDYTILRYSNVYGPRQDASGEAGVISIFVDQLQKDKTPKIFGNGKQTRDYIFVKDVAEANLLALETKTNQKIFNISTNTRTSVNQLLKKIQNLLDKDIPPVHKPPKKEVEHISLDNSKAKKYLNFSPKTDLDTGLRKTISHNQ